MKCAAAFARTARDKIPKCRPHQRRQIESGVLVEVPVFDRDDGLREGVRHILRSQLVALEDAAGGKDLPAVCLHHECARCRFDHQPPVGWNGRDAIGDVSEHKQQNGPERRRHRVRAQQGEMRAAPPVPARAKSIADPTRDGAESGEGDRDGSLSHGAQQRGRNLSARGVGAVKDVGATVTQYPQRRRCGARPQPPRPVRLPGSVGIVGRGAGRTHHEPVMSGSRAERRRYAHGVHLRVEADRPIRGDGARRVAGPRQAWPDLNYLH